MGCTAALYLSCFGMVVRIFILEAHSITRAGLRAHLEAAPDIHVSGEASDPEAGLGAISHTKPNVVLLGATLYRQEGDRYVRRLLGVTPQPALLVLADQEDAWAAERALKAGALGFVANSIEAARLVAAVRQVARQQVVVSPEIRDALLRRLTGDGSAAPKDPSRVLSEREMEVFTLTGQGLEAKEIAARFSISPRTVDVHRANIRNKLGIQGAHELMRYAMLWAQQQQDAERLRAFGRKASPLLLVEDDEVDILSVDRALRELGAGAELVVARTAEEALTHLRTPGNARPGLVLLDIKMPGMDGREFLAIVRKDASLRSLPIVVLTASQLEEDKLRMHSLGITGYLTKPASPAEFIQRLGLLARYWSVNEPPPAVPL